jgi:hypothetical protein
MPDAGKPTRAPVTRANHERTDVWTVVTIVCMVAITVLTRGFCRPGPGRCRLGAARLLRTIAALAVIVPEMSDDRDQLISTWQDAGFAVLAGAAWFYWRGGVLGTIIVGMAAYAAARRPQLNRN